VSLRNQIHIRIFTAVIISLITGSAIAIWDAKQSVKEEVTSSFKLVKAMLEFTTALQQQPFEQNEKLWISYISSMQAVRHIKIEMSDLEDISTNILHSKIKDDRSNNESAPLWFTEIMTSDLPMLRRQITPPGHAPSMIVMADPSDEIVEAWQELLTLFWSIVAILSVLLITINSISNTIIQAVQEILTGLKKISCSNFSSSLPDSTINEFDIIAKGINELSYELKTAQRNNRELTYHSLNIQERERKSIAQELHDEMGQSLTAIKAMAVAIKQQTVSSPVAPETIIKTCDHLTGIIRSRMRALHPLSLAELGLGDTLKNLVNEWSIAHNAIKIDLHYENPLNNINNEVGIHIYRIIQECLNNVAKHSDASKVNVSLQSNAQQITLSVIDNGKGLTNSPTEQGFGLRGIRERAESQGGTFAIQSSPGEGVAIYTNLPIYGKPQ
tara:strand:- start:1207 stop:2535 length:1329 start_codon:yes stop_codon:yes gene_type:complete